MWILGGCSTAVNTALQKALDEAGVEMPFNTYDINIINRPGGEKKNNLKNENGSLADDAKSEIME